MSMENVLTEIGRMDYKQLSKITKALDSRRNEIANVMSHTIRVGDKVAFTSKSDGYRVKGEVYKVNRKTAGVLEEGGLNRWRVSLIMLEREG